MPAVSIPAAAATCGGLASREFELLLACCSEHGVWPMPETMGGIDVQRFVGLCSRHGVLPQVYEAAARIEFSSPLQQSVAAAFQIHARRALRLTSELLRVMEELQARRIPVLPYKGPALAQMLYGNVAARQFGDLDFLLCSSDVLRAKSALQELGFTATLPLSEREEREYIQAGYEYVFHRGTERNLIELHWRVVPRFYAVEFDINGLFDRSIPIQVAGRSIPTICPEDLLLVLCVHAAKHAWANLSWLCDIAALSLKVDWPVVEVRARRLGIRRIIAITFALAKSLLGTAVPPIAHIDNLAAIIGRQLEDTMREGGEIDTASADYFRVMMSTREGWKDKLRFLSRLAFTPGVSEWHTVTLPDRLFPLYRLVRMSRLLSKLAA
jgi:hypothetical protein